MMIKGDADCLKNIKEFKILIKNHNSSITIFKILILQTCTKTINQTN
jgi:hypothetical protein